MRRGSPLHPPARTDHAGRFRSVGAAQRFLSAFSSVSSHFRPRRHLLTAAEHRLEMTIRFTLWDHITKDIGLPTQG